MSSASLAFLFSSNVQAGPAPAYDRRFIRTATPGIILMDGRAGATLSLNVLSFQTSLETWTTAAIINWKKSADSWRLSSLNLYGN